MRGMKIRYSKLYAKTDAEALNSLNNPDNKRSFTRRHPVISRIGYTFGAALLGGMMVFGTGVLAKKKGAQPKTVMVDQIEAVHKDLSVINELLKIQKDEFEGLPDITLGVYSDQEEAVQLKKDLKPLGINLDDYLDKNDKLTLEGIDKLNAKLDELSAKTSSEEVAGSLAGLKAPVKEEVKPEVKEEVKPPVTEAVPKKEKEPEAKPEVKEEEAPVPEVIEEEAPAEVSAMAAVMPHLTTVSAYVNALYQNYAFIFGKSYLKNIQKVPKTKKAKALKKLMPWTEGMSDEEVKEQAEYVTTALNLEKLVRLHELATQDELNKKEKIEFKKLSKSVGFKYKKLTDDVRAEAAAFTEEEMRSSITTIGAVALEGTLTMNIFNSHVSAGEYDKAAELLAKELGLNIHIVGMGVDNYRLDYNFASAFDGKLLKDFLGMVKGTNPLSVRDTILIGLKTLDKSSEYIVNQAIADYGKQEVTDLAEIEDIRYNLTTGKLTTDSALDKAIEIAADVEGMEDYVELAEKMKKIPSGAAFGPTYSKKDLAFALLSMSEVKMLAEIKGMPEAAKEPMKWSENLFKGGDPVGAMFFANLALNRILPNHGQIYQKYIYSHPAKATEKNWQAVVAAQLDNPAIPFVPLNEMEGTVYVHIGDLGEHGGVSLYTNRLDPSDPEVAALANMPQSIWWTFAPSGHNPYFEGEYASEIELSNLPALPEDELRYHDNPDAVKKAGLAPAAEELTKKYDAIKEKEPNSAILKAYTSVDLPLHHKLYLFSHARELEGIVIGEPSKKPKADKFAVAEGIETVPVVNLLQPELLSKGPDMKYVQVSDSVVTQAPDISDIGYETTGKLGIEDERGNDLLDSLGLAIAANNNDMAAEAADALLDVLPGSSTATGLTGDDAVKYDQMIQLLNQAAEGNKDALDEALGVYQELSGGRIAASTLHVIRAYVFDADAGLVNAVEFGGGLRTEFILKQKEKEFLMLYLQAAYAQSSLFGTVKEISVTELLSTGEIEHLEGGEEYPAALKEKAGQFGFGSILKKPIGKEKEAIWNFSAALTMSGGTDALIADIEEEKEVSTSDFFKIDNIGFETTFESAKLKLTPIGGIGGGILNLVELRGGEWDAKPSPYIFGVLGVGNEIFDLKLRGGSVLYPRAIPFVGLSGALMINGWTPFFTMNYTFNVSEKEGQENVGALSASAGVKTPTWHLGKMPMALEVTVTGAALVNQSNDAVDVWGGNIGVKGMLVIPIDVRKEKPTAEDFTEVEAGQVIDNAEITIANAEARKEEVTDTKKYDKNMEKAKKYLDKAKKNFEEEDYVEAAINAQNATDAANAAIEVEE